MFHRCSQTRRLKFGNLHQSLLFNPGHIRAKTACCHDRAAKGGVDVQDGCERPVDPHCHGFFGHDARNTATGLNIVHCRKRQRVGHFGTKGQTHPAAFQISADQQRNPCFGADFVHERAFIIAVRREETRDPGGFQSGKPVGLARIFAHRGKHKQLTQPFVGRQAGKSRMDPGHRFGVQVKRGLGQEIDVAQ